MRVHGTRRGVVATVAAIGADGEDEKAMRGCDALTLFAALNTDNEAHS